MVRSKLDTKYNFKRRQRNKRILPIFLAVLLITVLVGYLYRDSIYAYWEADKLPVQEIEEQNDPEDEKIEEEEMGAVEEVEEAEEEEETEELQEQADNKADKKDQAARADKKDKVDKKPSLSTEEDILYIKEGNYLLALVTKQTSLGNYAPTDLVTIPKEMRLYDYQYQLREEAYLHLREMWEAAKTAGCEFYVNSAYRSYEAQKRIFNDYAARHGEEKANEFSARPGQSEHQLGTTVDLAIPGYALSAQFGSTPPGQWLKENSYKYGFVMSYPEGSQEVTGYIYEPWHFRYIGVENAKRWHESGLVLCQFLELQPQQWK
ncbi:MAG: M15 family metallopeptidase [Firmicutes bacterium]|nr:M15 family metallopeptidase [Bacillota bacterium]